MVVIHRVLIGFRLAIGFYMGEPRGSEKDFLWLL